MYMFKLKSNIIVFILFSFIFFLIFNFNYLRVFISVSCNVGSEYYPHFC